MTIDPAMARVKRPTNNAHPADRKLVFLAMLSTGLGISEAARRTGVKVATAHSWVFRWRLEGREIPGRPYLGEPISNAANQAASSDS